MDNEHLYHLIAKKLAGEASAGDLKELESALRQDPNLYYSLEALQDMWDKNPEQETGQAEAAFKKHMDKMHALGIEMGKESDSSLDEFPDSPSRFVKWKILTLLIAGFIILLLLYHYLNF